jgi:hypothetical protein
VGKNAGMDILAWRVLCFFACYAWMGMDPYQAMKDKNKA